MPKVSICLPNFNTAKYLPERLNSIVSQSFQDWECIVSDNYSNDGAWEILQNYAANDSRFKLKQEPRSPLGMYPNWNHCLLRVTGQLVYIATSDDTMMPDCLEKMVAALDEYPECGLCQCSLKIIDENSDPHTRCWRQFNFGRFAPEWTLNRHIRPAPMDGILHCALQTIYTSITQLLVRKSVFEKYGLFETRWGSVADFEWGMRVGFLESCIYIPDILATWRVHPEQATGNTNTLRSRLQILRMAHVALYKASLFRPQLIKIIPPKSTLFSFYEQQIIAFGIKQSPKMLERLEESQFRRLRTLIANLCVRLV